jgi:hypothetical protein
LYAEEVEGARRMRFYAPKKFPNLPFIPVVIVFCTEMGLQLLRWAYARGLLGVDGLGWIDSEAYRPAG